MTTTPASELWRSRELALAAQFSETAEALNREITGCDAELTRATDLDVAVGLIDRRARARVRLEAIRAVRKTALEEVRDAAHEASKRDDRLVNVRKRLEQATATLETARNADERRGAEQELEFLQPRLGELEAEEAADVERARGVANSAATEAA